MTYANQIEYDNATDAELSDYRESPEFAEFAEFVTLEILAGRDCMGIDAQIIMVGVRLARGGYQLALELVSEHLTERQFMEWLSDY